MKPRSRVALIVSLAALIGSLPIGAFAQNSLTLTVSNVYTLISNPYDRGSNTLEEVLGNVPEGTLLCTLDAAAQRWQINQFRSGFWAGPNRTLPPGKGAFVRIPTGTFQITFSGSLPTTISNQIHPGYNLLGSLPQTPQANDTASPYNPQTGQYLDQSTYFEGFGWFPELPLPDGHAVLYRRIGASPGPLTNCIYFNNFATFNGTNRPIRSTFGCLGTNLVAQFYVYPGATTVNPPAPLGPAVRIISTTNGLGYLDANADLMRVIPAGATWAEVRIWDTRYPPGTTNIHMAALNWHGVIAGNPAQPFSLNSGNTLPYPPRNLETWNVPLIGPLESLWVYRTPNYSPIDGQYFSFNLHRLTEALYAPDFTFQWEKQIGMNRWIFMTSSNRLEFPAYTNSDSGIYRLRAQLDCMECTVNYASPFPTRVAILNATPAPQLAIIPLSNNLIRIDGSAPVRFDLEIQQSTNLIDWAYVTQLLYAPFDWSINVTNTLFPGPQFYRLRVIQ